MLVPPVFSPAVLLVLPVVVSVMFSVMFVPILLKVVLLLLPVVVLVPFFLWLASCCGSIAYA